MDLTKLYCSNMDGTELVRNKDLKAVLCVNRVECSDSSSTDSVTIDPGA